MTEKKFRSALFRNAASHKDSFREDLDRIWNMTNEDRNVVLEGIKKIIPCKTGNEEALEIQKTVQAFGGKPDEALHAVNVLKFCASQWDVFRDTAADVLSDLRDVGYIPEGEQQSVAEDFLDAFFSFLERDATRRRKLRYANALLPGLVGFEAVIDHRVVMKSIFDWGSDSPEDYQPECETTVPTVILEFSLNEKDKEVVFQVQEDELDMIIRRLEAAKKELQASRQLLK